jgi:hypothetical protein
VITRSRPQGNGHQLLKPETVAQVGQNHTGLANTYYWIDPALDAAGMILIQLFPFADKNAWRPLRASNAASMPDWIRRKKRRDDEIIRPSRSACSCTLCEG